MGYVDSWHNVRAQLGAFEGTKAAALPTLGIKGRFKVYGAGLEPMSALANSTFDRAGAANGDSPPLTSQCAWCSIGHKRRWSQRVTSVAWYGLGFDLETGLIISENGESKKH
jgi:hypothetical protein